MNAFRSSGLRRISRSRVNMTQPFSAIGLIQYVSSVSPSSALGKVVVVHLDGQANCAKGRGNLVTTKVAVKEYSMGAKRRFRYQVRCE